MSIINSVAKEIISKIVYYGPGLCGKTTNLEKIHEAVAPAHKGRLVSLKTDEDRTLFFDVLPINAGTVRGNLKLRFQLFTVPGQVYYDASRRTVLMNADGIVFVADSSPARLEANLESMQNLYDNCAALGIDLTKTPLVLQLNKRDLPDALPLHVLQEQLNFGDRPTFQAVACRGTGVLETLGEAMRLVEASLRK